jgi:MFS family permease
VLFRSFVAALWAVMSVFAGWLALWLLAALELPSVLQQHHPLTEPPSSQFEQTRSMFLAALALTGAAWGALLPARARYSERKLRELEATAYTMACLWSLLAVMILTITVLDDRSIWLFSVFALIGAVGWLGAAAGLRLMAVMLVRSRRGRELAAARVAESVAPRLPMGQRPLADRVE